MIIISQQMYGLGFTKSMLLLYYYMDVRHEGKFVDMYHSQ
jgi:hypothetical protein